MRRLYELSIKKAAYGLSVLLCLMVCLMPVAAQGVRIAGEELRPAATVRQEKIVASKSARQYFLPGMKGYETVRADDRMEFDSEAQAIQAGFRRAVEVAAAPVPPAATTPPKAPPAPAKAAVTASSREQTAAVSSSSAPAAAVPPASPKVSPPAPSSAASGPPARAGAAAPATTGPAAPAAAQRAASAQPAAHPAAATPPAMKPAAAAATSPPPATPPGVARVPAGAAAPATTGPAAPAAAQRAASAQPAAHPAAATPPAMKPAAAAATSSPPATAPGVARVPAGAAAPPAPHPGAVHPAASPTVSPPQSHPAGKDTRYVTIDFDNVDIQVFVKFVSELTGKNFVIDDKVKGKVTVVSPKKIAVDEVYKVFQSVLDIHGFATVPAGDVIKIVPAMDARGKGVETRIDDEVGKPEDRIVTQIISLEYANADEMKKIIEPLVSKNSIVLAYAPTGMLIVTDVLSNIKRLQEIIGALDVAGVGEQISYIPMKYATAADVVKSLTAVFQQHKGIAPIRIVAEERTNAVLLLASEADSTRIKNLIAMMDKGVTKGESLLHIYKLQNATAEDLAKVLMNLPKDAKTGQAGKAVLSKEVQIVADKATNTLIITAERGDYTIIESIIKQLDTPRPMVYIEALIMEVSEGKDFKLGVEWHAVKNFGAGPVAGLGPNGTDASTIGVASFSGGGTSPFPTVDVTTNMATFPASSFAVGVLGAGIKIGDIVFPNVGAVFQAYRGDSDVSVLATPQLLTLDNEDAEINVGKNVPYITRQDTSSTGTQINYSNYEYKDVGIILKVNPHINEDNFVRLKIDQQVTRIDTASSAQFRPTTYKRAAKTAVVVKDGETIVIGGLINDETEVREDKIPLLGDIPLLGWLFKYRYKAKGKSNLFIFITPRIVRNQVDAAAIYKQKSTELGKIEEGVIRMYDPKKDKDKQKTETAGPAAGPPVKATTTTSPATVKTEPGQAGGNNKGGEKP
ncbi:MAG TPA: type II secretion system secretin GspD [Syntrophales bacterium]|nr:type II secretion system secretin GspD [Syntrophales bacterium]